MPLPRTVSALKALIDAILQDKADEDVLRDDQYTELKLKASSNADKIVGLGLEIDDLALRLEELEGQETPPPPPPPPPPPDDEPGPDPPDYPADSEMDLVVTPATLNDARQRFHEDGTPFKVGLLPGVYLGVQMGISFLGDHEQDDLHPLEFYALGEGVWFSGMGADWAYFSINSKADVDNNAPIRMWGQGIKFFGVSFRDYGFAGQTYSYPNDIRDTTDDSAWRAARTLSTVEFCSFQDMASYGTKVRNGDRVADSVFKNIGVAGVSGGCMDVVVEDNYFEAIGGVQDPLDFAGAGTAAVKLLSGPRNVMRRNVLRHGVSPAKGLWNDYCAALEGDENIIEHNDIEDWGNYVQNQSAIDVEISRTIVQYNKVRNACYGSVTSPARAAVTNRGNALIVHNDIEDVQVAFGLRTQERMRSAWKDGTELEHRHVVKHNRVSLGARSDGPDGPYLHIVEQGSGNAAALVEFEIDIDENEYIVPASVTHPFKYEGVRKTWAEWRALGYDQNSTMEVV